ncbi:MAG: MBL fold metallo-hydrolase [Pseudomonadales bacterium]
MKKICLNQTYKPYRVVVALALWILVSCVPTTAQSSQNSNQWNADTVRFENSPLTPNSTAEDSSMNSMWDFFFLKNDRRPEEKLPEMPPTSRELATPGSDLRFIWFGHSTIMLDIGGKRVLFDPVFSRYASPVPFTVARFQPPAVDLEAIGDIDLVLISHNHYDHLDKPTIKQLKKRPVKFLVPLGVGAHLESWGIETSRITELDWWQSITIDGTEFTATPAQHFSGRGLFDRNKTLWASWSVNYDGERVFFSGDSGYGPHYKAIGDRLGPFDLTFLENGAYNESWALIHQFPEQAVQAHRDLQGDTMVPIHWGMFNLSTHSWYDPIQRVNKAAESEGVRLLTPKLGQFVDPGAALPAERWWP